MLMLFSYVKFAYNLTNYLSHSTREREVICEENKAVEVMTLFYVRKEFILFICY